MPNKQIATNHCPKCFKRLALAEALVVVVTTEGEVCDHAHDTLRCRRQLRADDEGTLVITTRAQSGAVPDLKVIMTRIAEQHPASIVTQGL